MAVKQRIVVANPPMLAACIATFGTICQRTGVIFSYGDVIYNPSGTGITRELMAHEGVHGERQLACEGGPDGWWQQYLDSKEFRLREELLAHRAEYLAARRRHGPRPADLRNIAGRLASELYGHLLTTAQATHAVLTGELHG